MSTPDQPHTPPLTRRRLRELRNTGQTPVIDTSAMASHGVLEGATSEQGIPAPVAVVAEPVSSARRARWQQDVTPPSVVTPHDDAPASRAVTPLPHPAVPAAAHRVPVPDASIDLEAVPLTRRQAREQERIRTASVPVIVRDVPPAIDIPAVIAPPAPAASAPTVPAAAVPVAPKTSVPPVTHTGAPTPPTAAADVATRPIAATAVIEPGAWARAQPTAESASDRDTHAVAEVPAHGSVRGAPAPVREDDRSDDERAGGSGRTTVHPALGARLLTQPPSSNSTAESFEELLGRGAPVRGVSTASHALILPHPATAPLVAPIDSTGEVLVTGTFALPDGMGSTGHAPGTTDGREVDAVLVDGELPVHSSPTPIAASAAVSTIRTDDDIVNPPAPEKGRRLMMVLAITAGVLALGLIGVLVYALATGVIA